MKRKVALKKHKNNCIICDKDFIKGDVYYEEKVIYKDRHDDSLVSFVIKRCAKCVYKESEHDKRFNSFKSKCIHPKDFQNEVWNYIPWEEVKEPDYLKCMLCGERIDQNENRILRNSKFTRLNQHA